MAPLTGDDIVHMMNHLINRVLCAVAQSALSRIGGMRFERPIQRCRLHP
jgi:hypothetical protein